MSLLATSLSSTIAQQRVEVIVAAVIVCGLIFELLRRERLMERYAIMWFAAGVSVLVLALWKGLLTKLAHAAGISYLPSALFAVAFLFVLVMLVHSTMTISRLVDQSSILAQRMALLQQRMDHQADPAADQAVAVEQPAEALQAPPTSQPRSLERASANGWALIRPTDPA